MFSPDIVNSDAFIEMPPSTQALYFQLGMRADDDGFVSPNMVMRMMGSTEDELRVLIAKRFVLKFDNGVIVVKHWRINNFVRKDRYKPSLYTEEKQRLRVKENMAYTLDETQGLPINEVTWKTDEDRRSTYGQPNVIPMVNAGKDRLGKDSIAISEEIAPPSKVREVQFNNEGEEKQPKEKKEKDPAWPVYQKALKVLSEHAEFKVLTTSKDFLGVKRGLSNLKEKDLMELLEEDLQNGWAQKMGYSLTKILSSARINKYKSDWSV